LAELGDDVRGPAGRIDFLPLAWKAATLTLSRTKEFRTAGLRRAEDAGLWMAEGRPVEVFVEKARLEAAARQDCLRAAGRTIDAISMFCQSL